MSQSLETGSDLQRQDTYMRILDAAERLFRHYGYAKTTVADIAKDLGMSPANIYRFFTSKVEIHQAICGRMLQQSIALAEEAASMPGSAEERLRHYTLAHFKFTVDTMIDEHRVHEMVIVAIERDWSVIDHYIDTLQDIIARIIADGMASGEFPKGDAGASARAFGAATSALHHPQLVAQCINKPNRATPEELTDFAICALKAPH